MNAMEISYFRLLNQTIPMKNNNYLKESFRIQLVGWPIYGVLTLLINYHLRPMVSILDQFGALFVLFLVLNISAAVIFMLSHKRWLWGSVVIMVGLFILFAEAVLLLRTHWPQHELSGFLSDLWLLQDGTVYWLLLHKYVGVLMMAAALVWGIRAKINQQQRNTAELEARDSEFKFLSAQMNQHFLYNLLQRMREETITMAPTVADAVKHLADLLRYTLTMAADRVKRVVIERELQAVRTYLELERFRFPNHGIHIEVNGEECGQKVLPGVFLTFIENAFKYGVVTDPSKPIEIFVDLGPDDVRFRCNNYIDPGKRRRRGIGTGLGNARYRLGMAFGEGFELTLTESSMGIYRVDLLIKEMRDGRTR